MVSLRMYVEAISGDLFIGLSFLRQEVKERRIVQICRAPVTTGQLRRYTDLMGLISTDKLLAKKVTYYGDCKGGSGGHHKSTYPVPTSDCELSRRMQATTHPMHSEVYICVVSMPLFEMGLRKTLR